MITFKDFLIESGMIQDIPPNKDIQKWMNENRDKFHKKHGDSNGERFLYSEGWKKFKKLNIDTPI